MALADGTGLPLAVSIASASPHEVTLLEPLLKERFLRQLPRRIIGDRAYDSDRLDERLRKRRIELIARHRSNRTRPATQDGRTMRRYKRRWKIERLFSWLQNYRRICVRWDLASANYLGFIMLGCIMLLLRRLL